MKVTHLDRSSARAGFTLIELLIVIAIMGVLAGFTLMGFQHAQTSAARAKTESFLTAIKSGLENYQADYGEYPMQIAEPTSKFGQTNYKVGGAMMLYQALSGDGTSEMKLASGGGKPSDGKLDDNEIPNIKLAEMPRDMWKKTSDGYILVDGFGKPFQYTKFVNAQGGSHAGTGQDATANNRTMNSTFDLWSFGGVESNTNDVTLSTKQNPKISAKWIKNW